MAATKRILDPLILRQRREFFLFYSTRSKLILSFLGVAVLVCGVALLVGGQLLYRGVFEAKCAEERSGVLTIFILITVVGMALAVVFGYIVADRINRPVKELIEASTEVSRGNLSPAIGSISKNEIGVLQKTFKEMLASLRQRDERQKAESETKLLQFEKQANIGRLAGGVAHEINNPLTGIVTFTDMLLRNKDLSPDVRSDLENIAQATERGQSAGDYPEGQFRPAAGRREDAET
jgi:nitrogen fixation/metabolism regulation signal transduction histidine kinase